MVRISRYILVFTAIIGSAIALPNLYWTIMEKPVNAPFVTYSCIDKTFMIQHASASGVVREDTRGNKLTREEYERKLPMLYFMQLATSGTMPDSINGIEMEMHTLRKARSTYRFQPKFMDSPQPGLYPLFESESGRVNLEMPDDFFRIKERVEFIECKTNNIREEKSTLFTEALAKRGFAFPSRIIAGLPTTKKSCDEGYLITDANNQLFHLKMVKGKPYVKRINLPDNLSFKWIECVDFFNKQFYAYMISDENEVYIVNQDTYELLKLPVKGFNPVTDDLKIYGDFFNYNVIIEGDSYLKNFALDTKFKNVDYYEEKWNDRYHRAEGKIFDFLFPFELSLKSPISRYIDFRINYPGSINWLLLSLLLVAGQLFWLRKQKFNPKNHLIDICLIFTTGIFGFIAVNVFQNKFFK